MKKLLVASAFVLSVFFAKAQEAAPPFSKGSKFITGALEYTYEKNGTADYKKNTVSIKPGFGYFITDDWAVGGALGYQRSSFKPNKPAEDSIIKEASNTFTVDPFVRKYFYVGSSSFAPFVELDASFGWGANTKTTKIGSTKTTQRDTKKDTFVWGANLRPGFNYKLSQNVALGATIGRFGYNNSNDLGKGQNYGFGFNLKEVTFGVLVFL